MKLITQLPLLLGALPYASVNLAALVGVLLGCVRRDAFCFAWAAVGVAALLLAAVSVPQGAEVAPLFPSLIAVGAAAWMRYGGWLRAPALALVAAAAWLPSHPAEPRDLRQLRHTREYLRDVSTRESPEAREALRRCLDGRPTVLAASAPRIAWQTHAIALYAPSAEAAFWEMAEAQDVSFVQGGRSSDADVARLAADFTLRSDCAPDLYERKRSSH